LLTQSLNRATITLELEPLCTSLPDFTDAVIVLKVCVLGGGVDGVAKCNVVDELRLVLM